MKSNLLKLTTCLLFVFALLASGTAMAQNGNKAKKPAVAQVSTTPGGTVKTNPVIPKPIEFTTKGDFITIKVSDAKEGSVVRYSVTVDEGRTEKGEIKVPASRAVSKNICKPGSSAIMLAYTCSDTRAVISIKENKFCAK